MSARRFKPDHVVDEFLNDLLSRAFKSRPKMSIGKWAESEHLMIPAEESHGAPGAYLENTEPVATIIHQFLTDPRYRVFIGPKPSRMGYTLAALVGIAYWLAHFTVNVIFCIDDQRQVKTLARTRIIPLLKSIRGLAEVMPADKRKLTALALFLKGITLYLAGARSIGDVTSKPAGLFVADELDQYRDFATGEASAFYHLIDRIMDVPSGKGVFFGKPRNEGDLLWSQMKLGTQHQCLVPCPHCGHKQPLLFENMIFEHCKDEKSGVYDLKRVERETYFRCISPACQAQEHKGRIDEKHKRWMIERHEWRQTYHGEDPKFPHDPRRMSILPTGQVYSLRPQLTWGEIAKDFITARSQGGVALAHYFRTRWGKPEGQEQAITKEDDVKKLQHYTTPALLQKWWADPKADHTNIATAERIPYNHGQCPWVPDEVYIFSDVQTVTNEKKWVKVAFRYPGEAALIDYGICMSYTGLIEEANRPIEITDWGDIAEEDRWEVVTTTVWIDEGGNKGDGQAEKHEIEVRKFCARPDTIGRFFPAKGAGGQQIGDMVEEKTRTTQTPDGTEVTIAAYHVSHHNFASQLYYGRIKKHEATLLAIAQGQNLDELMLHPPMWFPAFVDDQLITELCSEILLKKKVRGQWIWVWNKTGTRVNDFGDGIKGTLAMWDFNKPTYAPPEEEDEEPETPPPPRGRDYDLHRRRR